jgi:hypothetical protein
MRTRCSVIFLIMMAAVAGCSPTVYESPVAATGENHGGVMIPLTDNQAYVELLNGNREKKAKGKPFETTLVAYLFQSDQKTPVTGVPATVVVKMATPTGEQTIALKPEADTSDPAGSARFVSGPGPFELMQTGGEVSVQLGDKTLSGTFRGPR